MYLYTLRFNIIIMQQYAIIINITGRWFSRIFPNSYRLFLFLFCRNKLENELFFYVNAHTRLFEFLFIKINLAYKKLLHISLTYLDYDIYILVKIYVILFYICYIILKYTYTTLKGITHFCISLNNLFKKK